MEEGDRKIILKSGFDAKYYLDIYKKEILSSNLDNMEPIDHFMKVGCLRDYNPNQWFNTSIYKKYFSNDHISKEKIKGKDTGSFYEWLNQPFGINNLISVTNNQSSTSTSINQSNELVVSITSHPPRICTTWLMIESIMRQSHKPDRIILYLAEEDFPGRKIPLNLEILKRRGLEVRFSKVNYKVATKLIPSLIDFPNATIITGDDDRIYDRNLIKVLWEQHVKYPREIICPIAREYVYDSILDRIEYIHNHKLRFNTSGIGIFEGFTGILYPPHSIDDEVFNFDNFKLLTPCADDIWFQAMVCKKGTKSRGISKLIFNYFFFPCIIDGTQETGLFHEHKYANDWMVYRTFAHYDMLDIIGIPIINNPICKECNRGIYQQDDNNNREDKCNTCLKYL